MDKAFIIRNNKVIGAIGDTHYSNCPIGTVLSFAGSAAPHGYLLCDGSSYKIEDYPDLYSAIGTTYGGDSETFNVPNLVDKFIQGSNTCGTEKKAGLPNITGEFRVSDTKGFYESSKPSGTFQLGTSIGSVDGYSGSGTYSGYYMKMDASRSSSIYGKSNTVQPPALTMIYIIKAYYTNEGTDEDLSDTVINAIDNKIAEQSKYSVDERIVGTWIDGKPIYRKTFNIKTTAEQNPNISLASVGITDFENIVRLEFFTKQTIDGNKFIFNTPFNGSDDISDRLRIYVKDKNLCYIAGTTYGFGDTTVTLEYTKTVD